MRILDGACRKWRANFHTHTTESDGSKTPEEAMALARSCAEAGSEDALLLLPLDALATPRQTAAIPPRTG